MKNRENKNNKNIDKKQKNKLKKELEEKKIIKSTQNDKIKAIAKLQNKKNRQEAKKILINGIKCCFEYLNLKEEYIREEESIQKQKLKEYTDIKYTDIIKNSQIDTIVIEEEKYIEYQNMEVLKESLQKQLFKYLDNYLDKIIVVTKEVFLKLTSQKNPEGILLCIKYENYGKENIFYDKKNITEIILKEEKNDIVMLENVNDPRKFRKCFKNNVCSWK